MAEKTVKRYALDTFAILTHLRDEPGASTVEALILDAKKGKVELIISWISICEVYYLSLQRNDFKTAQTVLATIKNWPVKLIVAEEKETITAGDLKARYRISLGDAYTLGTAKVHSAIIVTGDPEFGPLEKAGEVKILWLPKK